MPPQTLRDPRNKDLGAYYTEFRVARALCRWALRSKGGRLLDPSFGGGVFLEAAAEESGENGCLELYGVELDGTAHSEEVALRLGRDRQLIHADFFALSATELPPMDAVVGNPPFIRFQRFAGKARQGAAARALEAGLELPPLAGSWVAFVAHATTFLKPGGRLAMVVPAELGHAPSARPLLELLDRRFERITLVTFRNSLFPHLDQQTILLLAEGYGRGRAVFTTLELPGPVALDRPLPCSGKILLDTRALIEGTSSLAHCSLDPETRSLYSRLAAADRAVRLGDVARVESGYVTGANASFHLPPSEAREAGLPEAVLVPAIFRSRSLTGLRLGPAEWLAASEAGWAGYLVQAAGFEEHPAVQRFLARLTSAGVDRRYKARTRNPWYRIGRAAAPPLILAGMASRRPAMVVNEAAAAVPNTFHAVTPRRTVAAENVAAAWLTSLTDLSLELEGHGLGGGLLKLDPGEARNVLLPAPELLPPGSFERLEGLMTGQGFEAARDKADRLLLVGALGLEPDEIVSLRSAAEELRARRRRS